MQTLLLQHRNPGIRAYFLWGPFIRSDNETAARQNSTRYLAPNTVHFWTPTPRFGADLAEVLRLPDGLLAWDVFLLYPKGAIWEQRVPRPAYWQHQLEILQGEPLNIPSLEYRILRELNPSPGK